jgi:hypothetical protein
MIEKTIEAISSTLVSALFRQFGSFLEFLTLQSYTIFYIKLWVRISTMARCTRYNNMWKSLSVTYGRSVVFTGYSGFLFQLNWPPWYNCGVVGGGNKYNFTPALSCFIEMRVPSQESERSCLCVPSQESERACLCVKGVNIFPLFLWFFYSILELLQRYGIFCF